MIGVADAAAVLTRPQRGMADWPKQRLVGQASSKNSLSPCARYAIEAVELLNPARPPASLVCITGPSGVTVDAFDGAWRGSPDGRLTGAGFGASRYRRIHPLTLVRSLQNQVAAALTTHFQWRGPCLNALESSLALAALLPNIALLIRETGSLLLVFSSAADRLEERSKTRALYPGATGGEGAVCFLLREGHPLGFLEGPIDPLSAQVPENGPGEAAILADPVLSCGLALLVCLAQSVPWRDLPLRDPHGSQAQYIRWRRA